VSKRAFEITERQKPPQPEPVKVVVKDPMQLPEREPRNILLMIALPALAVGIIGTLVVMYTSGLRTLQSGFFPMFGLVGFGALMFSGRFGRVRKISWGEQERVRRQYLRDLDANRDEIQKAADEQRRAQRFVHADPQRLATVIGGPRMWERRRSDADFLDVRLGVGIQQTEKFAVDLALPEIPITEELEPVTGRALRDFVVEQTKIRGIGKILSLRSAPGFSFIGDDGDELRALMRAVLCSLAVYHSPKDLKIVVVTRHPELWAWLVWLPHNHHDQLFDACGARRLVFASPQECEQHLDQDINKDGTGKDRGMWRKPVGTSPTAEPSPLEGAPIAAGPHWIIIDDDAGGSGEQWEPVTGAKGRAGFTTVRLAGRRGTGIGFGDTDACYYLRGGELFTHEEEFYAVADTLAEPTALRYARALARWEPKSAGEITQTDSQGTELLRVLGINDPRHIDVKKLWADKRGRGDDNWMALSR